MTSHWQYLTSSADTQQTHQLQNGQQQPAQWSYISLADNSTTATAGPYDYGFAAAQAPPAHTAFASYGQSVEHSSGQHHAQPNKVHQADANYFIPQQGHVQPSLVNQSASFQPYAYQGDAFNYNQRQSSAEPTFEEQSHQQYHPIEPIQQQQYEPQPNHFPQTAHAHHLEPLPDVQGPSAHNEEAPVFLPDQQGAVEPIEQDAHGHQADFGGEWGSEAWNDSRRSSAQNEIDWSTQKQRSRTASIEPEPFASPPFSHAPEVVHQPETLPIPNEHEHGIVEPYDDYTQKAAPHQEPWIEMGNSEAQQIDQTPKENGWDWDEKEDTEEIAFADFAHHEPHQLPTVPSEPFIAPVEMERHVEAERSESPAAPEVQHDTDHGNIGYASKADADQPITIENQQSSSQQENIFDPYPIKNAIDLHEPLAPIDTVTHQNIEDEVFGEFAVKKQVTPESLVDRLRRLSSTEHPKDCDVLTEHQIPVEETTSVQVAIENSKSTVATVSVVHTVQKSSADAAIMEEPRKSAKTQDMSFDTTPKQIEEPRKQAEITRQEQPPEARSSHNRTNGRQESKPKRPHDKPSYHNRIRSVKEQFPQLPEIIERLDRQRATTPHKLDWGTSPTAHPHVYPARTSSKLDDSGTENSSSTYPRKNSTPKEQRMDESAILVPRAPDVSAIAPQRPRSSLRAGSVDMSNDPQASYDWDEQGIDARRKARHRLRPPSRAESEYGDNGASRRRHSEFDRHSSYGGGSRHPHHPHAGGRYTPNLSYGGAPYGGPPSRHYFYYDGRPRPHSAFDRESYEREYSRMHERDYPYEQDEDEESESQSGESDSESATEEELIEFDEKSRKQQRHRAPLPPHDPRELYFFYVIRLPKELIEHGLRRYPPPRGYYTLTPIEKAAYLYYFSLYRKYMSPLAFRKIFALQYARFMLPHDSTPEKALELIVQWTKAEFDATVLAKTTANYQASQKQLFSDDRETPESRDSEDVEVSILTAPCVTRPLQSDRSYNEVADSDRFSVESAPREPLKYRVPHAFVRFGPGGRAIVVDPTRSIAMVEIKDVKALIVDADNRREIETLESFRGPLVAGQTPAHTVRLFVQRQLEKIKHSVASADDDELVDAHDCLLVWQLLDMVVQQQGRVTGPDLARLLTAARREDWTKVDGGVTQRSVDPHAHARFTEFLLGGHIEEALDSAVRDGLYADAMVMARRIFAGDSHRLDDIESKFLSTRPINNPVMTLLSVASDQPAPVLTNPPSDASGGWRPHAAIVLANLSSTTALTTVYHLGKALARRHRDFAADFCFLAVHLLAGWDVFSPPVAPTADEDNGRQHITLIHATLPGYVDSWSKRFKWSLGDLQATEVYDYAVKLANPTQADVMGVQSVALQLCKLEYATRLSEYGGFASDTFRYCSEIARVVWSRFADFRLCDIYRLCDLADSVHQVAAVDVGQTGWIESLRSNFVQQSVLSAQQQSTQPARQEPDVHSVIDEPIVTRRQSVESSVIGSSNHRPSVFVPPPIAESDQGRHRITSLSDEAASWHGDHQEPIEMHQPIDDGAPPFDFAPRVDEDMNRRASDASVLSSVRPQYGGYSAPMYQGAYDSGNSKTGTETAESSPHRDPRATPQSFYTPADHGRAHPQEHRHADFHIGQETMPDNVFASPILTQHRPSVSNAQPPMLSFSSPPAPVQQHPPTQPVNEFQQRPVSSPQAQQQLQGPEHASSSSAPPNMKAAAGGHQRVNSAGRLQAATRWLQQKLIPDSKEMKLPDDSKPKIVWDPAKGQYTGDVTVDDTTTQPPPVADQQSAENLAQAHASAGLRAARRSGGSRYFNSLGGGSMSEMPGPSTPVVQPPAPPVPVSYHGFIPSMPAGNGYNDFGAAEDYSSPFSVGDPFSYPDPSQQQQTEVAK